MADASDFGRRTGQRTLEIFRLVDAPPEEVFQAWTDPDRMRQWWGPNGFTLPVCNIDLRPGGAWHFCMRSPDGKDYWCKGVYQEIVPPERIVSTDFFSDEAGSVVPPERYGMSPGWPTELEVQVTFAAEEDGKTRLTVRQSVDADLARDSGAMQGWSESLDRLARHLSGKPFSCPMNAEPVEQHQWLQQLVGNWRFEGEASMGPDQPADHFSGSETVRPLGKLWTVAEGECAAPDGPMRSQMTLGYDPAQNAFVGTFVGSMMTHLWVYRGQLDEAGKVLTLTTEGPDFSSESGGMAAFEDVITLVSENERTLTSRMRGVDGQWHQVMAGRYQRLTEG
ncbi:MAG: DUF1579 family protein [Magnetospirillum sp.]|nr:DUF1579 family protein [Magnetospirillum sp.]